jgi:adenylate kinase family enzyme
LPLQINACNNKAKGIECGGHAHITDWNGAAMKRIHIIGGPGSGKTTLARQLSTRLHILCYELDTIGWEGGFGVERSLEVRLADISRIAAQPEWMSYSAMPRLLYGLICPGASPGGVLLAATHAPAWQAQTAIADSSNYIAFLDIAKSITRALQMSIHARQ